MGISILQIETISKSCESVMAVRLRTAGVEERDRCWVTIAG